MIINHNVSALNTYNKLKESSDKKGDSLEKLSSGKRINQAADDPAGMAISQKMKAQTKGLRQAKHNLLNGKSLVQTADAGLNEVQSLLQRMRELAVQAANDTLSSSDREEIQKEIEQLKSEVDNIANNTDFNGIKPLVQEPETTVKTDPNADPGSPKVDLVFQIDYSGSMTTSDNVKALKEGINTFVDNLNKSADLQVAVVDITSDDLNHASFVSDPEQIKDNIDSVRQDTVSNNEISGTKPYEAIQEVHPDGSIGQTLNYRAGAKKTFVTFTDAEDESSDDLGLSGSPSNAEKEDKAKSIVENTNVQPGYDSDDIQSYLFGMTGNTVTADDFDEITNATGGKNYLGISTAEEVKDKLQKDLINNINSNIDDGDTKVVTEVPGPLTLQVGPKQGEELKIELTDARASSIGIDKLKVSSSSQAQQTIDEVDKAIGQISSERAKFGAYENRIGHIQNNVTNYDSNITQSKARIKDADMAKEKLELSKTQILEQAGQALLSQSMMLPQGVLKMLPSDMQ